MDQHVYVCIYLSFIYEVISNIGLEMSRGKLLKNNKLKKKCGVELIWPNLR
jgi:hypothetical protein